MGGYGYIHIIEAVHKLLQIPIQLTRVHKFCHCTKVVTKKSLSYDLAWKTQCMKGSSMKGSR